jgi:MFS family permease
LLVPGFSIFAASFDVSLTNVTLLNGSLVMSLGVSAYLCESLATMYGLRLLYLIITLVMRFGCVWASFATTYRSLLGSRIFQGLGMGGFFSLAGTASINDVLFVHERGRRADLWNFAVIVSTNMTPIISGYVITALGWQWSFRILAIFMPETLFTRREEILGVAPLEAEAGGLT